MKKLRLLLAVIFVSHIVNAQNTITTDTILQLSTCAGGNIIVPFQATGTYPIGNVFTAQLSNAFGQFTTPINIGSIPFNVGLIFATIPANTNFGLFYKIRVISSNPAVTGTPCPNTLIITQVAQLNQIVANPNDTACVGDTVVLTAINPASSYSWSTGDTTASISVTQSGNYSVTTIDFLTCESDTSINVVFEPCNVDLEEIESKLNFNVSPNPSHGRITLSDVNCSSPFYSIQIINLLGETIYSNNKVSVTTDYVVDLSQASLGVYFIQLSDGEKRIRKKLIVQ
jgi:hypothetical protein